MRANFRKLTCVFALFGAAMCASADTTWTLNNVTFSDGAVAAGYFTMNSTFDGFNDWNINVVGSNLTPDSPDYHYVPANSNYYYISPVQIQVAADPFAQFMRLIFDSPLTDAGGVVGITPASQTVQSVDCSAAGPCGGALTGFVSAPTSSVPEPDSLFLALSVGALFCLIWRLAKPKLS